jgi:hypothetical protein
VDAPRKKVWRYVLLSVIVLAFGVALFWRREPRYRGKSLTEWVSLEIENRQLPDPRPNFVAYATKFGQGQWRGGMLASSRAKLGSTESRPTAGGNAPRAKPGGNRLAPLPQTSYSYEVTTFHASRKVVVIHREQ